MPFRFAARSFFATLLVWAVSAGGALAHSGAELHEHDLWTAWRPTADILIPALLVLAVYSRGIYQRRRFRQKVSVWRHVAFYAGAGIVLLALMSPIDPFAERAFWIHQIQHVMLRMLGPMLLALSWPEGTLVAGLPRWARRRILKPLASSRAMHKLARFLRNGFVVLLVFIASLAIWQIPTLHNAAVETPWLHYLMHVTMLLAGLMFFWRIFERAPPPKGLRYGQRIFMLIVQSLFSIVLGSMTTLKEVVLYSVYDIDGRLFVESPLADEQAGGFIIWVPAPMMGLIAILVLMSAWNRFEVQRFQRYLSGSLSNSAALEFPETAEELWMKVEKPNRDTALGVALLPIGIFLFLMFLAFSGNFHAPATP